ncbi:MmcQ/YjbR family DNA-binding protein [Aquibium microcysteis]|uniref:MmcQ/YjbR family DNA-binding protein n=1 Tax=Aquibium microcysteis TaxID=675281 RepID=UPI00165D2907|nr:MmcQ/YjbR family DNA-binding protein [Aquibium microcysteis]
MPDGFRARVGAICGALPGAQVSDPWGGGHDAWKVGDRMFACIGAVLPGVAVKCRDVETATMLKDAGVATHARYFHKSWVLLPEETGDDELRHRLLSSYEIIRDKLPAALRRQLASPGANRSDGSGRL